MVEQSGPEGLDPGTERIPPFPQPESVDWYHITLESPARNLALDEILLRQVDASPSRAILRTWDPLEHFVVVGRSNQVDTEVDVVQCRAERIPIFRRSSGGGAVVVGPGCLAYALALPLTPELKALGVAVVTRMVMETIASRLKSVLPKVDVRGTSDLVVNDRKFSGNSQRWLKHAFLHHGTVLYDFDLAQIGRTLKSPSREPDYRTGRPHSDFVMNVPVSRDAVLNCLASAWNAHPAECSPDAIRQTEELAQSRYEQDTWNLER